MMVKKIVVTVIYNIVFGWCSVRMFFLQRLNIMM